MTMGRVDAVILSGGQGKRLGGVRKGLLEIEGRSILARESDTLAPLVRSVFMMCDSAHPEVAGLTRVIDAVPHAGPLIAIARA